MHDQPPPSGKDVGQMVSTFSKALESHSGKLLIVLVTALLAWGREDTAQTKAAVEANRVQIEAMSETLRELTTRREYERAQMNSIDARLNTISNQLATTTADRWTREHHSAYAATQQARDSQQDKRIDDVLERVRLIELDVRGMQGVRKTPED